MFIETYQNADSPSLSFPLNKNTDYLRPFKAVLNISTIFTFLNQWLLQGDVFILFLLLKTFIEETLYRYLFETLQWYDASLRIDVKVLTTTNPRFP